MAQVTIHINGKPYAIGCEDGQERHLAELAALFDHQVRQVSQDVGQLGETRLFLMGALLLADELAETRARLQAAQAGPAPVLLRIWRNVGHGWATDKEVALTENTEWLAFAMKVLGMRP